MQSRICLISMVISTAILGSSACGAVPGLMATPTPTSTLTPVPPTITPTPLPTSTHTPLPTNTPHPTPKLNLPPFVAATLAAGDSVLALESWFDTFDDNSWGWNVEGSDGAVAIENGSLQLTNTAAPLMAVAIPIRRALKNSVVQVDINPSPDNDPNTPFIFGAGCRSDAAGTTSYFHGVLPAGDGYGVILLELRNGQIVDRQIAGTTLPDARPGAGFTATFTCAGKEFSVGSAKATNAHLSEGGLYLAILQPNGVKGTVSFDNLIVIELP